MQLRRGPFSSLGGRRRGCFALRLEVRLDRSVETHVESVVDQRGPIEPSARFERSCVGGDVPRVEIVPGSRHARYAREMRRVARAGEDPVSARLRRGGPLGTGKVR